MRQKFKQGFSVVGYVAALVLSVELSACTETQTNAAQHSSEKVSSMNIRFDIEGLAQPTFATLQDSPATQDFSKQLPLTLELTDYASSEKIADLPEKLSTPNAPKGHAAKTGDITYYAPWGNLAIFYKDFGGVANGLVYLDKFEDLPRIFSGKASFKVTISSVSESQE